MRVFDCYNFNVIDKVKFKDTSAYIENMLAELGMSYTDIGFRLHCGPAEKALTKYPGIKKYYCLEDENAPAVQLYTNENITSFSENWSNGEIYTDPNDHDLITEIFSKIPRTLNFTFATLIFGGINWYENADTSTAIQKRLDCRMPNESWILGNNIIMDRTYGDGNKVNTVCVTIESSCEPEPRDTSDIIEKLIPYFGEIYFFQRKCVFSDEEDKRFKELQIKFNQRFKDLFDEMIDCNFNIADFPDEPLIKNVADRRTLKNAFKGLDFEFKPSKGMLPGSNILKFTDSHNYKYSILFDRPPYRNCFGFDISVSGYNFSIHLGEKFFGVKEKGESFGIISKLSEYCIKVRDIISEELFEAFGNTPGWY